MSGADLDTPTGTHGININVMGMPPQRPSQLREMKMALSALEEEKDENDSRYFGISKLTQPSSFEQGGGHSTLKFANLAAS